MNRGDYLRVRSPMVSPVATKPSLFFKIKINFRENRTSGYPICTATALSGLSNPTNLKIQITYINRYNPLEPVLPGFFPLVTNGWHSRYKSFSRCKFWNLGKVRLIDCLKDSKNRWDLKELQGFKEGQNLSSFSLISYIGFALTVVGTKHFLTFLFLLFWRSIRHFCWVFFALM